MVSQVPQRRLITRKASGYCAPTNNTVTKYIHHYHKCRMDDYDLILIHTVLIRVYSWNKVINIKLKMTFILGRTFFFYKCDTHCGTKSVIYCSLED